MGMLLLILGGITMLVGGIWLLVVTFQESVGWGLGSMLVPLVALIFVINHWEIAKTPFLVQLGGLVLYVLGASMSGGLPA